MKKICFSLMTAAISLISAGCFFNHGPVGVPGKEVILPAKAGEKSHPVGGFIAIGNRWAAEQTEVFAERVDDKIKFEIVCYGNTSDLEWSAKKPDDDMTLFGGEHVELLIAPFGLNNDGKYYHLDATFDNSLGKGVPEIRYDYFNLDDSKMFRDHEPVIWNVPACTDGDSFYYKEKKISFTKVEEVKKRALQAAKKGKPFIFHWRGGYLTKEILKELLEALTEAATEKGRYLRVSLNWPQAVLHAEFSEIIPEQAVVMEEANEGEQL